jgi:hypothetical protein
VATGTATYITTGVNYGGYTFVGTSGTKTTPAIIDASAVLWSQFGYQVQYGQGLYKSVVDGSPIVSVDSSLNFIQYLDNTDGPIPGTMYIGTNTNTVNIGKTNTVISGNVGIGKTPSSTLDVSGNIITNYLYLNDTSSNPIGPNEGLQLYQRSSVVNYDNNATNGSHNFAVNDSTGTNQIIPLNLTSTKNYMEVSLDVSGNLNVNAGSSQTTPPAVNIIKDTGTAELFGVWQHNAQLQVQNLAGNSLVLAMSTDASAIIQGKTVNGPYNNLLINPLGGDVSVGSTIDPIDFTVNGNLNVTGSITNNTITTLLNVIYPVGSIYMNFDSSLNPATLLSWPSSTWLAISGGFTLAAFNQGLGDPSFNVLGSLGGSPFTPPHNHQWYVGKESSNGSIDTTGASKDWGTYEADGTTTIGFNDSELTTAAYTSKILNNSDLHSNYAPYLVVSMWIRTG